MFTVLSKNVVVVDLTGTKPTSYMEYIYPQSSKIRHFQVIVYIWYNELSLHACVIEQPDVPYIFWSTILDKPLKLEFFFNDEKW